MPQPQKRPRSSLIRFEAELPNEMWQADITHWPLASGRDTEILNMVDDHSRLFVASRVFVTVKAADVVDVFRTAIALHGAPASLLCDNGAVFTATPRGGKVLLQVELERLGIAAKNSRPYHPQTCGKVERLHQTLKRYLAKQEPARTLAELQGQIEGFLGYYNATRPHRALGGRTPLEAYGARLKARPPRSPQAKPTSGSAKTRSTPAARSPCATGAACTTSASVAPTMAGRSGCWSPSSTSASSTPGRAS